MSSRKHTGAKIQALFEAGVAIWQIAKDFKISRNTVRLWCRRTDGQTEDKRSSGRPRKLSPTSKDKIMLQMKDKVS